MDLLAIISSCLLLQKSSFQIEMQSMCLIERSNKKALLKSTEIIRFTKSWNHPAFLENKQIIFSQKEKLKFRNMGWCIRGHITISMGELSTFSSLRTQIEPSSHLSSHQYLSTQLYSLLEKNPAENKDWSYIYLYFLQCQAQCLV